MDIGLFYWLTLPTAASKVTKAKKASCNTLVSSNFRAVDFSGKQSP